MINAFIYDATVLEYLASVDDGCKLRTVSTWNAKTGYGIGFPKGSKWIKSVNKLIINFQHTGELARDRRMLVLPRVSTVKRNGVNGYFFYFYCGSGTNYRRP